MKRVCKPGPNAIVHREHRRNIGASCTAPLPMSMTPQYQSGPRHGQQLAFVRKIEREFSADRAFPRTVRS